MYINDYYQDPITYGNMYHIHQLNIFFISEKNPLKFNNLNRIKQNLHWSIELGRWSLASGNENKSHGNCS